MLAADNIKLEDLFPGIKATIALDLKNEQSMSILKNIISRCDVLIDPFRPGVLEKMGLGPDTLLARNPRLIIARLTGFRRDGPYAMMAGHDINYLAVSGVLSQLGRAGEAPYAAGNIIGDFAAGGLMCAFGVFAALLSRAKTGRGQVVENNMVDGAAYLGTFLRVARKTPMWNQPRGYNLLDGGCPWYDTYQCKDGGYMSVGALEPQFFRQLLLGLELPANWMVKRNDRQKWSELKNLIRNRFLERPRPEWETVFDGKDACCTPVLSQTELEESDYEQRQPVVLSQSKSPSETTRGANAETILNDWMGWRKGQHYQMVDDAMVQISPSKL